MLQNVTTVTVVKHVMKCVVAKAVLIITRQMLKASRGEPDKYKLRYIGVKAACV